MKDIEFDYIVVGAGSAGCVLAARLSEDPSVNVLLVEAGPDVRPATAPAALRSPNAFQVTADTVSSVYCWTGLTARRTAVQEPSMYWRGRGLGGSSAINGQIAIQGLPEDFDHWRDIGCVGWGAAEVLADRVRMEDDVDFGDRDYHGRGGPIPIYRASVKDWGAVDKALREAALELGYGWASDHSDPAATGVSPLAINSRNGTRVSASDGYLEPARHRANLRIRCDTLVDRVLVDNGRAAGIVAAGSDSDFVRHGGEVILSAGAVFTAAILIRSGIGPTATLIQLGIPHVATLPVGKTLVEHPAIGLVISLKPHARASNDESRHINCCVRYSSGLADSGRNDMMIFSLNLTGITERGRRQGYIGASVFQAFSRGEIRVVSTDPLAQPEVELNLLSDVRDLIRLRDGVRRLIELAQQRPFESIAEDVRPISSSEGFAHMRPSDDLTLDNLRDDSTLDEWLHASASDAQHIVGTCPMGPDGDVRRVVDPHCRVIGIRGLRIVDASVMPTVPRANTHLPTLVIAEHMARELCTGLGAQTESKATTAT